MPTFQSKLSRFKTHLDHAHGLLATFQLDGELRGVAEAVAREEFRVSVLGRFKTGKSSVINGLLGQEISPHDVLPCTSTIIEFRPGTATRYFEVRDGVQRAADRDRFTAHASSARGGGTADGRIWRVETAIPWVPKGVVLVDTPGTDEDPSRLKLANAELDRTDAAVVVLNATQVGTLSEMDQVEELRRRVGVVVLVVNKIDMVSSAQRDRLLQHARSLAERIGIPAHRVMPASAQLALKGNNASLKQLEEIRGVLSDVLLGDVAGARLQSLMARTEGALQAIAPKLDAAVAKSAHRARDAAAASQSAKAELAAVGRKLEVIERAFSEVGSRTANEAANAMENEWPRIVSRLVARKDDWKSKSSPLFSPKQCATEIGNAARRTMEQLVAEAVADTVQPRINGGVQSAEAAIADDVLEILGLASAAGVGRTSDLEHSLHAGAVQSAFGRTIDDAAGDSAAGSAVTVVVSAIVGYVIADIILFYVLGLVAGFLNPVILAGAVVVGIGAYVFMGEDALRAWMRSKIADKLSEELSKGEVRRKATAAVRDESRKAFDKLASAYVQQLRSLIDRARGEWERREQESRDAASSAARSTADAGASRKAFADMLNALSSERRELEVWRSR